jgi:hypothetical protein
MSIVTDIRCSYAKNQQFYNTKLAAVMPVDWIAVDLDGS